MGRRFVRLVADMTRTDGDDTTDASVPTDQSSAADPPRHPLRYLARHRRLVATGVVFLLLTNGLAQAIPWVVKHTIEALEQQQGRHAVALFALLLAALAVAQSLTRILSRTSIFNAAREAEYELRQALFAHLSSLDGAFFRSTRIGDLMSRLTNDLAAVRALFGPGLLNVTNTAFAYALALPLMLYIDVRLTLLALAPYPILLLGARAIASGIYLRSRTQQQALGNMTTAVQEDLAGVRELKAYQLEQQRAAHFGQASADYLEQALKLAAWRTAILPVASAGVGISVLLVLWFGGPRVNPQDLTLGDLVAMNLYVGGLAWPTLAVGWMVALWQRGLAAWHRLVDIFAATAQLEEPARPVAPPSQAGITASSLSVSVEHRHLLRDVSFDIPPGTICAVVGRVGSGKTTLVEALARLIPVPSRCLFVGGRDVTQLPIAEVRRLVAYAPQDAFLFSVSLGDNIAFGLDPDISLSKKERDRRIADAVHVAGLEDDVEALPAGVDTIVGERGISLSGGQRQRVGLARALVAQRPILIIDDALSAVDADTERRILARLRAALASTTTIMTSHRLSALQHTDQIIVLEQGAVAERGTHAELLQAHRAYSQLYRRQLFNPGPGSHV